MVEGRENRKKFVFNESIREQTVSKPWSPRCLPRLPSPMHAPDLSDSLILFIAFSHHWLWFAKGKRHISMLDHVVDLPLHRYDKEDTKVE